ncbi:peptidase M24 [Natronobacterium texcoconense]|uniref:Xaa-Pro aminopeptidase n=1 Tax=Natronobacterium texcoconense TaxID=1095778 RepID=A0A1H1IS20_NATTX|nr:peptidase M24 [Natronobacterium texcoconense]SDR40400.1 Xaa-Pro aminopeptidase [Natronobacterium texcoconense]
MTASDGTEVGSGRSSGAAGRLSTHVDLEAALSDALESTDAAAFVHVGTARDPRIRYLLSETDDSTYAVAYDGDEWLVRTSAESGHPADRLAGALASEGTVLTPAQIPHDAALYLENQGFELASTDALERARATKTSAERERIEAAQQVARAGIQRGAELLATATTEDDSLVVDGEPLTVDHLRIAIDEAMVAAGGFPAGNTAIESVSGSQLRPGEPIVVTVAPREPGGYHGSLARTFVADGDGGRERRTHVGMTQAFRSTQAMLTADTESVTAVEADLEAEIRAFGEDGPLETNVAGIGVEPAERPIAGADDVAPGSVVRIDVTVSVGDGSLRIADLLAKDDDGVEWLAAPSRSLSPAMMLE